MPTKTDIAAFFAYMATSLKTEAGKSLRLHMAIYRMIVFPSRGSLDRLRAAMRELDHSPC